MSIGVLRQQVLEANLELVRRGLVLYTFGNASGILREQGLVVIKPSGIPYEELRAENMVVTDLDGNIVEGQLRPSSDLETHLVLYREFKHIGGIVHTHSEFATAWAQAHRPIPCLGTTHADYFSGDVPVTAALEVHEIETEYEKNTGVAICRTLRQCPDSSVSAILVAGHGPFTWGKDAADAVHNAVILESVARVAYYTVALAGEASPISRALHDKHYLRKHGLKAYYGQASTK